MCVGCPFLPTGICMTMSPLSGRSLLPRLITSFPACEVIMGPFCQAGQLCGPKAGLAIRGEAAFTRARGPPHP